VKVNNDKKVFFSDVLAALSNAHFERNRNLDGGKNFKCWNRNLDMQPEHSNTASEKIPLKKKKSIFIWSDSPLESEELTVAHYLAADLIWEAWERRKRSWNVYVYTHTTYSHFYVI
jgi:hypothetical protein